MGRFEHMSKEELKKLCSKGGKATPKEKRTFFKDRELAKKAGRKGAAFSTNNFKVNRDLARRAAILSCKAQGKIVDEET